MNCVEIQELLSAYIDNQCTETEKNTIEAHIASCPECAQNYQLIKSMVEQLNQLEEKEVPLGFHNELMHKIHEMSPKKKQHFMRFSHKYSIVAAAFLFCVIFGVVGSSLLMQFSGSKKEESYDKSSEYKAESYSAEMPMEEAATAEEAAPEQEQIMYSTTETEEVTTSDEPSTDAALVAPSEEDLVIASEPVEGEGEEGFTTNTSGETVSDSITDNTETNTETTVTTETTEEAPVQKALPENQEDITYDVANVDESTNNAIMFETQDKARNTGEEVGADISDEAEGIDPLATTGIIGVILAAVAGCIYFIKRKK